MQPRTLDQINASLGSIYDPQVQSIQKQQAALPAQQAADQAGLKAQEQQSYQDILNGARARGTGIAFGGIPLQEQAQYNASTYLPALAKLQTSYNQHAQSLSDAINQLNANRYKDAQSMYSQDQANYLDYQKLLAAQKAASAASTSPTLGDIVG